MLFQLYRNSYGGLSRPVWILALVLFVNRSGTMVVPFLTVYLTQSLGFSLAEAGWVMASFGAGSVLGTFLGGLLTDRIGSYRVQVGSLALGGILFLGLGMVRSLPGLCLTSFVLSTVGDAFRPANTAAVARYSSPETRTRSYALARLAINLGWSIGPALGGFLATRSYQFLFWADGLTCLLAAGLLAFLLPDSKAKSLVVDSPVQATRSPYRDGVYLLFVALTTLWAVAFFQFFSVIPIYYKTHYALSESTIGLVLASNGVLIVFVEMLLVYGLENRGAVFDYIRMGTLLVGLAYVLFNVFDEQVATVWVATVLITFGEMLAMPFMQTFASNRGSATNRGQYLALYSMSWSAGQILAPLFGTQVAERMGFPTLWWALASVCVTTQFGFAWLYRKYVQQRAMTNV